MHADIKIIDPIWTSAYNICNYGYMVYDTLLAMGENLVARPQMLDGWKVSDDKLESDFAISKAILKEGAMTAHPSCCSMLPTPRRVG